jgi:hypothetical protein
MPSILEGWQRLLRFRAEREATQRVLQLRAGETPSTESQCSDGSWIVTPNSVKFSRKVPVPQGIVYPLEYSR